MNSTNMDDSSQREAKLAEGKSEGKRRLGYPSRSPDLDVLSGFQSPPEGYGEVAFYWWVGEALDKERLEWQLCQLKDHHITALQINYAHGDEGGLSYGLTYPSDPPLFSEEWWELFRWFAAKAGEYGISVSLSDYTLCTPGQGSYADEILAKYPDLAGSVLQSTSWDTGQDLSSWAIPLHTLSIMAVREEDGAAVEVLNLNAHIHGDYLHWSTSQGIWRITAVHLEERPMSIDPTHPRSGELVIAHFFQRFEDRLKDIPGARLGFFFSDELDFGLGRFIWSDALRQAFIRYKGYDPLPELAGLFVDIGSRTTKIRLDYGDVMVELSEDHYFKPVFDWHERRGLIYGCDHGGRGKDPIEFGDYFRTQRWNQGPGCDQPNLACDLIKNKVASSIAHLYERPRTWLEGFYGSGWGTTTAALTDAIFRNFVSGHNLLTLHGLYYTTYGGWWEWAPPCNHFRMPYWSHMESLMGCTERLSYVLSQGYHVCDVAVVYPVASLEAGLAGDTSLETAFGAGDNLFKRGIDFDFIDHQSIERAKVESGKLAVAGESYKVLILPAMRAIRGSTLHKALDFFNSGGIVIAIGCLPEASERAGSSDPQMDESVRRLFGWTAAESAEDGGFRTNRQSAGGIAKTVRNWTEAVESIEAAFPRDFYCSGTFDFADAFPFIQHRRIGQYELYAVYNVPRGTECFFRCHGSVELWNPWDGSTTPIPVQRVDQDGTWLCMPLEHTELHLLVFRPVTKSLVHHTDVSLYAESLEPASIMSLGAEWSFHLLPTMDNRFGDFRQPASNEIIGSEARFLRFAWEEDVSEVLDWHTSNLDDSCWRQTEVGYGPFFWRMEPITLEECSMELEQSWALLKSPPQETDHLEQARWTTYAYSTRYGIAGDPGHQGYHGLKGNISDAFLSFGRPFHTLTGIQYEADDAEIYYLWSTIDSDIPQQAELLQGGLEPDHLWLNGRLLGVEDKIVPLHAGNNTLLARYSGPGRGYIVFASAQHASNTELYPLAMSSYNHAAVLHFNAFPQRREQPCWYRFNAPPGLEAMELTVHGEIEVWSDGISCHLVAIGKGAEGAVRYQVTLSKPVIHSSPVAIRLVPSGGFFEGAAIPEPIQLKCGEGLITLGDWSEIDGLQCYSGGAVYRKYIHWNPQQAPRRVIMQLGHVSATAAVKVNGKHVRTLLQPPWEADITAYLNSGDNEIEVCVYNTLANHYKTIPTQYRGELVSGLLGPVQLVIYGTNHHM
ncbi:glycosyl hydrolase [Paenibacillus sp. FSL R5-0519]|uniref:glycosyl hydrolase n=1 Tax=Paenibacillus sp. FSL R5-0519 TaxID=2921648 RepID=UPI0030D8BF9F